jgi:hypothetical protein
MGCICAALVLTKPNVGVFAIGAVALALSMAVESLAARRWVGPAVGAALVALPFVLMSERLAEPAVMRYAVVVSASMLAVVVIAFRSSEAELPLDLVTFVLAGILVTGAFVFAIALAEGVSPSDYVDVGLVGATRLGRSISSPLGVTDWDVRLAGGSVVAVGAWALGALRRVPTVFSAGARLVVGAITWIALIYGGRGAFAFGVLPAAPLSTIGPPLALVAPLAWVAAIPGGHDPSWKRFGRVLITALAVLSALQAYPVAGSQMGWGSMLLALTGAICLADGWQQLRPLKLPGFRMAGALAALAVVFWIAWQTVRPLENYYAPLANARDRLGFPGATRLHLDSQHTVAFRWLVGALRRRCSTFVGFPGLGSLYLYSGLPAPSAQTSGNWMGVLDSARQQTIVDRLKSVSRPCLVKNRAVAAFWSRGQPFPARPLLRYVADKRRWSAVGTKAGYELLVARRSKFGGNRRTTVAATHD